MQSKTYVWYVEPMNSFTNGIIGKDLQREEDAVEIKVENLVKKVWRCDYHFISRLYKSRNQLGLCFNVFVQRGNGKVRKWKFGEKNRKTKRIIRSMQAKNANRPRVE